eukprot:TRINITY_DN13741_c0_g1_i1.p1 TRINITY_DN13741_c0_g1~~TRINITY_DN13741_c0_g1_i1.p1  ORF type:complete len:1085 (+),score=183.48 TRINITY_DN13741_c0_g1_i1:59-3313(+)
MVVEGTLTDDVLRPGRATDETIRATFHRWDVKGDGVISERELRTVLLSLGIPKAKVQTIFQEVDTNGSGGIDIEEFVAWLSGKSVPLAVKEKALEVIYRVKVEDLLVELSERASANFDWWTNPEDLAPFVRWRDVDTSEVICASPAGRGLKVNVDTKRLKKPLCFEISSTGQEAVGLELCISRSVRGDKAVSSVTHLRLQDLSNAIADGMGRCKMSILFTSEEKQKTKELDSNGKQVLVETKQQVTVGRVTFEFAEAPSGLHDLSWANYKIARWKIGGLPSPADMPDALAIFKALAMVPDQLLELAAVKSSATLTKSLLGNWTTRFGNNEKMEVFVNEIVDWQWKFERAIGKAADRRTQKELAISRQNLAKSLLSDAIAGDTSNHVVMKTALRSALKLEASEIAEVREVEMALKSLLNFPEKMKMDELLRTSDEDAVQALPATYGLPLVSDATPESLQIKDQVRFGVRDDTAQRVLAMLGCNQKLRYSRGITYEKIAVEMLSKPSLVLPGFLQTLLSKVTLFRGEKPKSKFSPAELIAARTRNTDALIGRFDVVAMPVCAEYDKEFKPRSASRWSKATFWGTDPNTAVGGEGWFWIFHAAALNIGESAHAEDFEEYSMQPDFGFRGRGSGAWLDEDKYVVAMDALWKQVLRAAAHHGVEDMVAFPFGMGAFLRNLHRLDNRYSDDVMMRRLRFRVASGLFDAAAEVCTACSPAMRLHVCLYDAGGESRSNHNVFIEAAGAKLVSAPALADIVKFHRNCDAMELAHELSSVVSPESSKDQEIRKVGLLNGANNKLLGNHWFAHGARTAIDENLHRRSGPMCVGSLMMNLATEPVKRNLQELVTNVESMGGSVVEMLATLPERFPPEERDIIDQVVVVPYSVLGTSLPSRGAETRTAPEPGPHVAFLDPAGLQFISGSPGGAGGASGSIYEWLGIKGDPSFPDDVRSSITKQLQAKFHDYGGKRCIHVVGPDFRGRRCAESEAVADLAQAYKAALVEFVASGANCLRLLPVSSGIFAGPFASKFPGMTAEALERGFALLQPAEKSAVFGASLELCIFAEAEFPEYEVAFGGAPGGGEHEGAAAEGS